MTNPPAGWYEDPFGASGQRFWDGRQWTNRFDPPREEKSPAPKSEPANVLPVWSSLREFSGFEIPECFVVTDYMREEIAELFADPNADTSGDSPLLAAMAYAIFSLEANTLVNLVNMNAQILVLKRANLALENRLMEAGVEIELLEDDLLEALGEQLKIDWN